MAENRVVQGRMVTPTKLGEIIEGEDVMDADAIETADRECPRCGEDVLEVGYMPDITEYVTGWKCQECDWKETDRSE